MKTVHFFIIALLAIILPFTLVLFDKVSWELAIAFVGPALYAIYSEWKVNNRNKAFKQTRGITYSQFKKR